LRPPPFHRFCIGFPSEKAWAEARRREAIVREILASPSPGQAVAAHCAARGLSNSTLYRWMRSYRDGGLRGLVPDTAARGGAGKSRLGAEREALLDDIARRFHEQSPRQSFRQAYPGIVAEFRAKGMAPPGVNTARAHVAGRRARRAG
jgi:transposase-like protein